MKNSILKIKYFIVKPTYFLLLAISYLLLTAPAHASVGISKPANNLNLVGWWRLDEGTGTVAHDFSGRRNNGTLLNIANPPTSNSGWTNGKVGTALNFDGTDDTINSGSNNSLNITGDGTISLWVKPRSFGGSGSSNIIFRDNGSSGYILIIDNLGITNGYSVLMGTGASVDLPDTVVFNTWQYLTITKTGTTVRFYLNGVLANTGTSPGIGATNQNFYIGSDGTTGFFDGSIDDVRIYTRALSAGEVSNLYRTGSVTIGKPTIDRVTSGLVAHWSFDGRDINWGSNTAIDSAGGNTGTITNMSTTSSPVIGKIGQALWFSGFDGGNNYVNVPSFTMPSTGTFSAWVSTDFDENIAPGSFPLLFDTSGNRTAILYNSSKQYALFTNAVSTNRAIYLPGGDIKGWWHLTVTWSANGSQIYKDGVAVGTPGTGDNTGSAGSIMYIGARADLARWWPGKIDDVRVYNRVLSASEVKSLANSGFITTGKSDATSVSDGLVGYWPMDGKSTNWGANQTLDMSGFGNFGTMTNMSTTTSPTLGKIGQALNFDGVNDYIGVGNSASFTFTNMSVCSWIYQKSAASFEDIASKTSGATGWEFFTSGSINNLALQFVTGNGGAGGWWNTSAGTIIPNRWQHVCVTYDNSVYTNIPAMYIDGVSKSVSVSSAQVSLPTINNSATLYVGSFSPSSYFFPGPMDDVRIYNRVLSASDVQKLYKLGSK